MAVLFSEDNKYLILLTTTSVALIALEANVNSNMSKCFFERNRFFICKNIKKRFFRKGTYKKYVLLQIWINSIYKALYLAPNFGLRLSPYKLSLSSFVFSLSLYKLSLSLQLLPRGVE